ncbi:MAG: SUMF1/EgtB/PvdO family nonheme iron enzyme [Deltaproteobacteria bacterium]|nr:SUMF1/EgtB/PvdO family nonheme iron enzyme [Deltaproteobacteria bacterium]
MINAIDRPFKKLLRCILVIGCLLVFAAFPVRAVQAAGIVQGEVTAVEGENIRIDVGSEAGLKVGDQGKVFYTVLVGKERQPQPVYVASFTITSIEQESSGAKIEKAQGVIMAGYLVEVMSAEAPPEQAPPVQAPVVQTPVVQAPTEPVKTEGKPPPEKATPAKVVKKKRVVKRAIKPGEVWRDPRLGMSFVWVPEGCFEMGCGDWMIGCSDSEKPPHRVCLNGFWMGRHEVTQQQWRRLMGSNPSDAQRCGNQCPVEEVSWNEAVEFARKLSAKTGYLFRLPTEAEWEYTCRSSGKNQPYAGAESVDPLAWYKENADGSPHAVGRKLPNDLGIFDMSGNVWEWCLDSFDKDAYLKATKTLRNPVYVNDRFMDIYGAGYARILGMLQGVAGSRSVRGGSWKNAADRLRSTDRIKGDVDSRRDWLGFRLVREEIKKK